MTKCLYFCLCAGLLLASALGCSTERPEPESEPCPLCPGPDCPRRLTLPAILPTTLPAQSAAEDLARLLAPAGTLSLVGDPREGGPEDGGVAVQVDLPVSLRAKNVGGRDGAGLCVFTSIMHAARYQNERRLWDFQAKMRQEPGGGYPDKVDQMMARYGADTPYLQYEGKDPAILELALESGRMPGVTYNGHDPHYRGTIAHMVNLVYLDSQRACILDNNFIGDTQLVWLSREEFLQRWCGRGNGWAVILLAPAPPPAPQSVAEVY